MVKVQFCRGGALPQATFLIISLPESKNSFREIDDVSPIWKRFKEVLNDVGMILGKFCAGRKVELPEPPDEAQIEQELIECFSLKYNNSKLVFVILPVTHILLYN